MSNALSNRPEALETITNGNWFTRNSKKMAGALGAAAVLMTSSCAAEAPAPQSITMFNIPSGAVDAPAEFDSQQGLRYEREIGEGSIVQSLVDHVNEIDPTAHADWDTQEVVLETDAKQIEADYRELFGGIVQPETRVTLYKDDNTELWHAELNPNQSDIIVE